MRGAEPSGSCWIKTRRASERSGRRSAPLLLRFPAPATDLVEYCEGLVVTQGDHLGRAVDGVAVAACLPGTGAVRFRRGAWFIASRRARARARYLARFVRREYTDRSPSHGPTCSALRGAFSQAGLVFDAALAFLQPLIDADPRRFRVLRSAQSALGRGSGNGRQVTGAGSERAHPSRRDSFA